MSAGLPTGVKKGQKEWCLATKYEDALTSLVLCVENHILPLKIEEKNVIIINSRLYKFCDFKCREKMTVSYKNITTILIVKERLKWHSKDCNSLGITKIRP